MSFISRIVPKNRKSPHCSQKAVSAKKWKDGNSVVSKTSEKFIVPKQNRRGGPFGLSSTFASINKHFQEVSQCRKTQKRDPFLSSWVQKIRMTKEGTLWRHQKILGKKSHNVEETAVGRYGLILDVNSVAKKFKCHFDCHET